MKIIVRGSFDRDIDKIQNQTLKAALDSKLTQIESAKSPAKITGLKFLRGYTRHVRIIVKTERLTYRIGGIIRGNKIWLVRFLPRKKIYKQFP